MQKALFQFPIAVTALLFLAQPRSARGADTAKGFSTYHANCATCHGKSGGGSVVGKSLHAPDLRSNKIQMQSDASLARFISEGKEAMPSFKDSLTQEQIHDEVRYIRTLHK